MTGAPATLERPTGRAGGPALDELVELVLDVTESPIDAHAVAATLESQGLRDLDARERYGRVDIFDLAEAVHAACLARLEHAPPPRRSGPPRAGLAGRARRSIGWYLQGAIFALPLGIQVASLVGLDFSLWAFLGFTYLDATAVALAVIVSSLVMSGFEQAIGFLAPGYAEEEKHTLARSVTLRIGGIALVVAVGFGLGLWLANASGAILPKRAFEIGLVYYALLCILELSFGIVYSLKHWPVLVISTVAGLIAVGLALELSSLSIYAAHWLGISFAAAIAYAWCFGVLWRRSRAVTGELALARLPSASVLIGSMAPRFAYGLLYSLLIFLDRLIAWSATDNQLSVPILFDTPYELGLDWALVAVIPSLALLQYSVMRFVTTIIPLQESFSALSILEHNRHLTRLYGRQLLLLTAVTGAAVAACYWGMVWLGSFDQLAELGRVFADPVTRSVFVLAVGGYGALVWGLLNGVFLFSLSRSKLVLRALAAGVIVSGTLGLYLSRALEYWYSAAGMAAGCLVFATMTTWYALRVLREADYHYYAAY